MNEQRNKKRALKDKSKKQSAAKKPMSKAQGKKKVAGNKKASTSAFLWYDSSEEEGAHREVPVARARIVHGPREDSSDSGSSPPYDDENRPEATSSDASD